MRQIAANAGAEASVVTNEVKNGADNYGYNAGNDTYGDMIEMGILDPTKVTRSALQFAASIASLMITTECMITDAPQVTQLLQCLIWAAWAAVWVEWAA